MKNIFTGRAVKFLSALILILAILFASACNKREVTFITNEFTRSPAITPNPMKGFAVFYGQTETSSDSSMEYIELRFNDIYAYQDGRSGLITDKFEKLLSNVINRGHTAIVRVYMLNPGYVSETSTGLFLPDALYTQMKDSGDIYSDKGKNGILEYPDFNSEKLIECMTDFIRLFANKYDGHAAIATIQMGLYGSWGEWNLSGCSNGKCIMTNENLKKIIEAYVSSFRYTKLMVRNPSLGYANEFPIGYHDDNFMFNTSDFHTKNAEWKELLVKQDPSYGTLQQFYDFINGNGGTYEPLWDAWKTQMFGGELSMQMYMEPFGPLWSGTECEALEYCVKQFHVTWLMGFGQGSIPEPGTEEYQNFKQISGSFGYDIYIDSVIAKSNKDEIKTSFGNSGIAPFYYDWPIEYRVKNAQDQVVYSYRDTDFKLSKLLPGKTSESSFYIPKDLKAGEYTVEIHFVNPAELIVERVMPLRLSNDHELKNGYYELVKVTIK